MARTIFGVPWTEEDLQIIKDNYSELKIKDIIPLLNIKRTRKAIQHIAQKLGLRKHKNHKFVISEEEKYKEINGVLHKICRSCKRYFPLDRIYFQADKGCTDGFRNVCKECKGENFGIRISFTKEEDEILFKYYSIKTNTDIQNQFLQHKTVPQIAHRASSLGLRKNEDIIKLTRKQMITDETRKKMSKASKGKWAGKNNPKYGSSRTGELNPNWKGGTTPLYFELRTQIKEWQQKSMENCNYKCILTGKNFDNIHHLYPFKNIVEECFDILELDYRKSVADYTEEEFENIVTTLNELHFKYGLGVCLIQEVHKLFHDIYGYLNNTPTQFEEFKTRYKLGEFEDTYTQVSSFS